MRKAPWFKTWQPCWRPDGYDLIVIASGVWLPAHKSVLSARSPVFAAMFRHDLRESVENCVTISDINVEVFRQFMHFLYTDQAPLLESLAAELLVVADKYDIPGLKRKCEVELARNLHVENVAECAVLGLLHSCPDLKAAAVDFIRANCLQVMATKGWADAMKQHTDTAVEICSLLPATRKLQTTSKPAEERRGSLADDLAALLESEDGCDATLVVGESELKAHKAVLSARSSVLAAKLQAASDGRVQVADVEEKVLKQVLQFIYTDRVPLLEELSDKLLPAAYTYNLPVLKKVCERRVIAAIKVDNAVKYAVAAITHSYSFLQHAAIDFIRRNIVQVMATDGWEDALRNHTDVAVKMSKLIGSTR